MKKSIVTICWTFVFSFLVVCDCATAQVIFEENFDSKLDWHTKKSFAGGDPCISGIQATACTVPNWTAWKNDEIWNPYDPTKPRAEARPGLEISSFAYAGVAGKALIITNEHHNGTDSSGWGSDTILAKDLGADFKELYMQFKIKYQPGFTWDYPAGAGAAIKTFRWAHWDRISKQIQYSGGPGTNNENAPMFFLNFAQNSYLGGANQNYRCDSQQDTYVNSEGASYKVKATHISTVENAPPNTTYWYTTTYNAGYSAWAAKVTYRASNYYCGANHAYYDHTSLMYDSNGVTNKNISNTVADSNWHTIKLHIKFNTDTNTADGVYELFQDGHIVYSKYDMKYIDFGGDPTIGINTFMFGGNNFSNYPEYGQIPTVVTLEKVALDAGYVPTTVREQWYAIDDVVVSTTDIPANYVIGHGAKIVIISIIVNPTQ